MLSPSQLSSILLILFYLTLLSLVGLYYTPLNFTVQYFFILYCTEITLLHSIFIFTPSPILFNLPYSPLYPPPSSSLPSPSDPVSLLEVEITDLDRRVGLCLGSTDEVSRFKRYLFTSSAYTRYFYTSEDNTRSYDSW